MLSIAISYLILFELYSLLYRAISLQILLNMRLGKRFKMQRKNLLLIYPNGGAQYIWETRLNGLLKSKLLARENVLIKITQTTATVFSQTTQEYHLVTVVKKTESATSYRCTNREGNLCNLIVMPAPDEPGYILFIVEFSDAVWYYKCRVD